MNCSLYVIEFENGKKYFGISKDPAGRLRGHERHAQRGSGFPVHRAIEKYNYAHKVLLVGEQKYVADAEIRMIAAYDTTSRQFGYNVTLGGELSPMRSEEIRRRVSETKKIRCSTPEFRVMMAAHNIGRKASPETLIKLRNSHLGQRMPEAQRLRQVGVPARNKGVPATKESREKNRKSALARWERIRSSGVDTSLSSEHRAKISATLMGHPGFGKGVRRTDEVRAKISAKKMGHLVSEKTRRKISTALRARSTQASS